MSVALTLTIIFAIILLTWMVLILGKEWDSADWMLLACGVGIFAGVMFSMEYSLGPPL